MYEKETDSEPEVEVNQYTPENKFIEEEAAEKPKEQKQQPKR